MGLLQALNKLRFMASDCLAEATRCMLISSAKLIVHRCPYHYASQTCEGLLA